MIGGLASLFLLLAPLDPARGGQDEKADEAQIKRQIAQMGADFLEEREAARSALEKAGKQAERHLIDALASADFRVRKGCVELLTKLKSAPALPRVAEIFRRDEDPSVKDAAFEFLRNHGKEAEEALIAALDSENPAYRHGAVQALAAMKSEKCAERVADLYDREQEKAIKDDAFRCLQGIGKPAEPFLLKLLGSADPQVRLGALRGLRKIQTDEVLAAVGKVFVAEADATTLNEAFDYLKEAGPKAEPRFVAGLRSSQEAVKLKAIDGLRGLKSEGALGAVAEVFQADASDPVRESAANFMKSHAMKSEEAFVRALGNPNARVRLLSIRALGEIKSARPLDQIAAIYHERQRDKELHKAAFEYLRSVGARAEKDLLRALSEEEDKELKKGAIESLGHAKSAPAIPKLIEILIGHDADLKGPARDALVRVGTPAIEAVQKAVADATAKYGAHHAEVRPLQRAANDILGLFYQEEVERLLGALVTDEGGSGFYEGMFGPLEKFGKEKALPVLLKILGEHTYAWRTAPGRANESEYRFKMRELAVMALGELGDARVVEPLKAVLADPTPGRTEDIREEIVVALHRRGERKPLEDYVKKLTAEAEATLKGDAKVEACNVFFSMGLIRNRVGQRAEAEASYRRVIQTVEEHKIPPREVTIYPTTLYNLACLAALGGEREKAVDRLRSAVEAGFKDRAWIRMDQDLAGLRSVESYKKLLADEKLFEKKPDE